MKRESVPKYAVAFVIAGLVVLIDQSTKAAAIAGLSQSERIPVLGDALGLQLAYNPGAVLSLGSGATWVLTVVGVGAVAALFVAAVRARTTWRAWGLGFILGGAIGNVLDRLLAPPGFGIGHVTDFLAYGNWFIGNLADVALAIGGVVLVIGAGVRHRAQTRNAALGDRPDDEREGANG